MLKKNFISSSVNFYLNEEVPAVGSELYHVGSLRGQFGSNSVTPGIISQVGRLHLGKIYDQTSCTAFPGSSGGGVFLKDSGLYIGMLVRGSGETFNLIVPVRRIRAWAERMNILFILDPDLPIPTEEELEKIPIEDTGNQKWELRSQEGSDQISGLPDFTSMPFIGMSIDNPILIEEEEMDFIWEKYWFLPIE